MKTKLSKRLSYIAKFIDNNGGHFYDLCCDHGQLGLFVLKNYSFKTYNLIDQVPDIINNLSSSLKDSDIPNSNFLNLICLDATMLRIVNSNQNIIVMAGIGGELTIRIIANLLNQITEKDILILSPHNNLLKVRTYLRDNGFSLIAEGLVEDNNKFYEVIKVQKLASVLRPITLSGKYMKESSDNGELKKYYEEQILYLETKLKYTENNFYKESLKEYIASKNKLL